MVHLLHRLYGVDAPDTLYTYRVATDRSFARESFLAKAVVDPDDRAGGEVGLGVMPPAGVQRQEGAKPPRSWSINAFCVMEKAFS